MLKNILILNWTTQSLHPNSQGIWIFVRVKFSMKYISLFTIQRSRSGGLTRWWLSSVFMIDQVWHLTLSNTNTLQCLHVSVWFNAKFLHRGVSRCNPSTCSAGSFFHLKLLPQYITSRHPAKQGYCQWSILYHANISTKWIWMMNSSLVWSGMNIDCWLEGSELSLFMLQAFLLVINHASRL